jgi:hypothetical protein
VIAFVLILTSHTLVMLLGTGLAVQTLKASGLLEVGRAVRASLQVHGASKRRFLQEHGATRFAA